MDYSHAIHDQDLPIPNVQKKSKRGRSNLPESGASAVHAQFRASITRGCPRHTVKGRQTTFSASETSADNCQQDLDLEVSNSVMFFASHRDIAIGRHICNGRVAWMICFAPLQGSYQFGCGCSQLHKLGNRECLIEFYNACSHRLVCRR